LKTPSERKEFLRSTSPDKFVDLYQYFEDDTNKLRNFLSGLDLKQIAELLKQIAELDEHFIHDYQEREIFRAIPLKDLKILMDKFGVEYENFITRQYTEYFNTRETYNERKGFVRELELEHEQVVHLYNSFENDPNKQKEICRAMAKEDLEILRKENND